MKEIQTTDAELSALMDELESMLEDTTTPATKEKVNEQPATAASTDASPAPSVAPVAEQATPAVVPATVASEVPASLTPPPWESDGEETLPPVTPAPLVASAKAKPSKGLAHIIDVAQFQKDTLVTELNMDQAMIQQAGLRAYYAAEAAYAEAQAAREKAKFEVVEAQIYDKTRKALTAAGEKVTEKMVETAVKLDSAWLLAKNSVIEADTIAQVNKGLSYSLGDRRDMLIQLGSDRRVEQQGQLRIGAADAERKSLTDRAANAMQRS